jgi:hypothetical protein
MRNFRLDVETVMNVLDDKVRIPTKPPGYTEVMPPVVLI